MGPRKFLTNYHQLRIIKKESPVPLPHATGLGLLTPKMWYDRGAHMPNRETTNQTGKWGKKKTGKGTRLVNSHLILSHNYHMSGQISSVMLTVSHCGGEWGPPWKLKQATPWLVIYLRVLF